MNQDTPEWVLYRPLKWVAAPATVNASRLAPAAKAQLWRGIRQQQPVLASMLETDPAVKAIIQGFGASLVFEKTEFDTLMQAGSQTQNG